MEDDFIASKSRIASGVRSQKKPLRLTVQLRQSCTGSNVFNPCISILLLLISRHTAHCFGGKIPGQGSVCENLRARAAKDYLAAFWFRFCPRGSFHKDRGVASSHRGVT